MVGKNNFNNKVVIVTGSAQGMGKAVSKKFGEYGAKIVINDVNINNLKLTKNEFVKSGFNVIALAGDVTKSSDVKNIVNQTIDHYGRVDILVNNAGITKDNLLMRMSETDFDKVIEVNLKSVFNLTKAVIRPMMKKRSGSIINMSSVVGLKGNAGQTNYAASKAGIVGFSKSVALELGSRNVRSNVIAPGFIETEMTAKLDEATVQSWRNSIPLKRGGKPEDIANACVFLASDMSSYITGQTLSVDGGMLT